MEIRLFKAGRSAQRHRPRLSIGRRHAHPPRGPRRSSTSGSEHGRIAVNLRKLCAALVAGIVLVGFSSLSASAHDGSYTPILGIVTTTDYFYPSSGEDPYNGYRVYLSSPRHGNSGSRGECYNPGREENQNGRQFNWRAANGNFIGEAYTRTNPRRNLHSRGYYVAVSPNTRDNRYRANRDASRNWGSDLHIVTHTNASNGCNSSASYLLTLYDESNDQTFASNLGSALNPGVPSSWSHRRRTDLAELGTGATFGDAYVELQFHDNQSAQTWLYGETHKAAWRYGYGVDQYLSYP